MDHKLLSAGHWIARRTALQIGLCLALAPRIALAQTDPTRERPREGDVLVPVGATPPKPLKPEDLPLDGKQTFSWPMDPETGTVRDGSRLNKVLLLRLDPEGFDPETKEHAAEGVVAYSAVCVHTGCDVTEWHADQQLLVCPCHYSTYAPKEGAKVVSGPAPRRLPALPLKVVDGRLVVAKSFTGRAGFQQM
jgi:rieske iron-sulfur protein